MPLHMQNRTYRLVTSLSYDLVNSTELMQSLGVEAYALLLQDIHGGFRHLIEAAGGVADLPQGDGCMCHFGVVQAQPQAKYAALSAALSMRQMACDKDWPVRFGLAYGEVAVLNGQAIGRTVHLAERLQKIALMRQILVSAELAVQCQTQFIWCALDAHVVCKGFETPVPALELLALRQVRDAATDFYASRPTHLHGRQQLLKNLRHIWTQVQNGQSAWVRIQGDAGIGKTALVQALLQQLDLTTAARETSAEISRKVQHDLLLRRSVYIWSCSQDRQQTAYHPLVCALQDWARMQPAESPDQRASKLAATLDTLPLKAQHRWVLQALLDVGSEQKPAIATPEDAQAQPRLLLQALLIWLRHQSQHGPFVLVIEDVHWADASTLHLLGLLSSAMQGMPAMVLTTQRPEMPGAASLVATDSATPILHLQPLDFEESCAMVRELFADQHVPPQVLDSIAERAGGVPLFIREAVRLCAEHPPQTALSGHKGLPVWMPKGLVGAGIGMSHNIREILMQRMDALGHLRVLAQLTSVIADEFSQEMLMYVALASGSVSNAQALIEQTQALVESGFLVRQAHAHEPHPHRTVYRHAHALLREVAYQSIWATDRQRLHQLVLDVYVREDPAFVQAHPATMAQHCLAAGQTQPAIEHFVRAAQINRRKGAHRVSIECCEAAWQLLESLPPSADVPAQKLQMALLAAGQIMATHGYGHPQAGHYFRQALGLSLQLQDSKALAKAQLGMHSFHLLRGEFDAAEQFVHEGLQNPQTQHDPLSQLLWQFARGMLAFYRGHMQSCADTMAVCEDLARQNPHAAQLIQNPQIMGLVYRAFCLWSLGQTETAITLARQGVALAEQQPLRLGKIQANGIFAMLMYCRGDWLLAQEAAEQALQAAEQGEYLMWTALARFVQAAAQMQGQLLYRQATDTLADKLLQMQQALQQWVDSHTVLTLPFFHITLAQCQMAVRQWQAAQDQLDQAQALVARHGERYFSTELQRTQAMLSLQKDLAATAAQTASGQGPNSVSPSQQHLIHWLEQAYTDAHQRGLHSLSLRVALSMHEFEQQCPQQRAWFQARRPALHWIEQSLHALSADSSTADARQARALLGAGETPGRPHLQRQNSDTTRTRHDHPNFVPLH